MVEQLQQEVKEAEAVVAENTAAVHQQQSTVNSAVQAAQQATAQVSLHYTCVRSVVSKQVNDVADGWQSAPYNNTLIFCKIFVGKSFGRLYLELQIKKKQKLFS